MDRIVETPEEAVAWFKDLGLQVHVVDDEIRVFANLVEYEEAGMTIRVLEFGVTHAAAI